MSFVSKKRKFDSLCCFEVQQTNVLLLYLRFDSRRDLNRRVSMWKSQSVSFVSKKRKFDSLCCFEVQQTNVLLLSLRYDSERDWVCWVSVWKKSICVFCVEEEKIRLTVLFRSAADKCSAPLSSIWFELRCNLVSVCMKKSICVFCVEEEKIRLTVLYRSAADKCSAPFSPIWFRERLRVSVWKSRSVSFVSKKRKFDSLCCIEVQQTNVLLLSLRYDSERD